LGASLPKERWSSTPAINISTFLPRPPEEVWAAVATADGVNAELMPLVRMTFPKGFTDLRQAPLGEPAATCWLLAFGVIPFERHTLMFADIGPSGFVETSLGLFHYHYWSHERTVRPAEGGCVVRDIVTVWSKIAFLDGIADALTAYAFRHRHKRLKLLYS
jgi:ligand-binding SRPBCC domain-containing protein